MKKESIFPYIIALILTLIAIIAIFGYTKLDYESRKTSSSISISKPVSIVTSTMPSQAATVTVEPLPTPEPIITPTTVVISLIPNYLQLPTGSTGEFKSIERASMITRKDSKQWYLQQLANTDNLGFRRFNEYYLVSMGTFYAKNIGQTFQIEFEERIIMVMIGDVKRNIDTIQEMYCRENGSIVEFIIDETVMSPDILYKGDVSSLGLWGKVISIEREVIE